MSLQFGKRYYVGNFYVQKFVRGLSSKELKQFRKENPGLSRHFNRSGVPFIRLSTVSGSWRMEWSCTMRMFGLLDSLSVDGDKLSTSSEIELRGLVTMMYTESTVLGDNVFLEDRFKALNFYLSRIVAPDESKEEESLKYEEAKFNTLKELDRDE